MSGNDAIVGDGILGSMPNMMTLGLGPTQVAVTIPFVAFDADIAMGAGIVILGPVTVPQVLNGLNSEIQLGLFRYAELKYDDELGQVLHLTVWSGTTGSPEENEDYMLEGGEEDWNILIGEEDWGFGNTENDLYDIRLIGTNDSHTEFAASDLINLISPPAQINRYSGDNITGQYFIIKVSALDFPKTYRIFGLEVAGTRAGRLN